MAVFYPIFLDLNRSPVVVVGGGKVGLRKARGLLEAGARVRVISPAFDAGFHDLEVERITREYEAGDLAGMMLAFAATDSREVNRRIGEDARALGIPVNIADSAEECGFIVPARVTHGHVQIAISTGAVDPRLAAELRVKVQEWLAEYQR